MWTITTEPQRNRCFEKFFYFRPTWGQRKLSEMWPSCVQPKYSGAFLHGLHSTVNCVWKRDWMCQLKIVPNILQLFLSLLAMKKSQRQKSPKTSLSFKCWNPPYFQRLFHLKHSFQLKPTLASGSCWDSRWSSPRRLTPQLAEEMMKQPKSKIIGLSSINTAYALSSLFYSVTISHVSQKLDNRSLAENSLVKDDENHHTKNFEK